MDAGVKGDGVDYAALFELSPDGWFVLDDEGRVQHCNTAFAEQRGLAVTEVIGRHITAFAPPAQRSERATLVRAVLAGERSVAEVPARQVVTRADGALVHIDLRLQRFERHGRPRLAGFARDVTQEVKLAEALQAREADYRAFFDQAPDALLITDDDARILLCNEQASALLGARVDASALDLMPRGQRRPLVSAFRRLQQGVITQLRLETQMRRAQGGLVVVELQAAPIRWRGQPAYMSFLRDIGDRRAAQRRLHLHYEHTPLAIMDLDAQGLIRRWNRTAERLLGRPGADLADLSLEQFAAPGRETIARDLMDRLRQTRRPLVHRGRGVNLRGEELALQWFVTPSIDEAGDLEGFVAVAHDETAQHQLEQQLQQTRKMEALGQLAGGVAHDFNNVLAAIIGFARLGKDRLAVLEEPPEKLDHYLQSIEQAGERAAALVRQLLSFSRAEAAEPRIISVDEVVDEVEPLMGATLPATVHFTVRREANLPRVLADPTQLQQSLINLLVNARDALPEQHGSITLIVDTADLLACRCSACGQVFSGRFLCICVTDDGCGVPADRLTRIFDPFYTTKEVGQGTGLGLSALHGFVHHTGGHVLVLSEPGEGTRFQVLLPPADASTETTAPLQAGAGVAAGGTITPGQENGLILVADDEPALRELLSEALTLHGYQVHTCPDAATVLKILHQIEQEADPGKRPPLRAVITDQTMPGTTGTELATQLRRSHPELPVLLLSGNLVPPGEATGNTCAVLRKPVQISELLETLTRVINPC